MELRQLTYFRVVAETQNITKAAKQLYISQPALSTAIARLEQDIGVLIFERSSNRITLTEAGRCFLEHVNSAFSLLDEGVAQAKQIANRNSQSLRIASAFGMTREIVNEYCTDHPERKIDLTTCDTDQLLTLLTSGEVEFALHLGPIPDSRLNNQVLLESRYSVAVNQEHPFSTRDSVTLKELESELLFCSNIARTYERAMDIFQRAGLKCNLLKLDEKEVLFEAARKGLGIVFCMPMISEENKLYRPSMPDITFIPIADCAERGSVVLVKRKDTFFTEAAEQFLAMITERFRRINEATRLELIRRGLPPD